MISQLQRAISKSSGSVFLKNARDENENLSSNLKLTFSRNHHPAVREAGLRPTKTIEREPTWLQKGLNVSAQAATKSRLVVRRIGFGGLDGPLGRWVVSYFHPEIELRKGFLCGECDAF